eukprot:11127637-Ditylum_brightwellii.AAC.2
MDGGQTEEGGYFGWTISTETTIPWRGGGYTQHCGHLMESLYKDSVSLLSLLRFLLRYSQYHGVKIQEDTTIHYNDNLTLVRRMN